MIALVLSDMTDHVDVSGLEEVRIPALFVWGREDQIQPLEAGQRMAADVGDAELVVYEDMGHMSHLEIPEESGAAAKAFLRGLARRAGTLPNS